jgi:hypothetical protein
MPAGLTPSAAVSNRNAQITWPAVTVPGGIPVDGYKVFRYDTGGTAFPVTSCTGTIAGLACTETAMAPGTWRYAVAPVFELWQGAEGPRSSTVTISAPVRNLTGSTDITSFPAALNGSVNNFIPGQTLSMRLDDPTTGLVLAATVTPNTIPAGGTATVQVTVPNTVSDGNHTIYAIGSAGDQAGRAQVWVDQLGIIPVRVIKPQFNATISYTPATRRVTVVLGARTTGGMPPARVNQSVTATYTPHPAMMAPNAA